MMDCPGCLGGGECPLHEHRQLQLLSEVQAPALRWQTACAIYALNAGAPSPTEWDELARACRECMDAIIETAQAHGLLKTREPEPRQFGLTVPLSVVAFQRNIRGLSKRRDHDRN